MKRLLSTVIALISVFALTAGGFAGTFDEKCVVCHKPDNKPAPSKSSLLSKFKTAKELIGAAKASKNPMMKAVQGDDDLLKKAAQDLGLK